MSEHRAADAQPRLDVPGRIGLLLDEGSFVEDGRAAVGDGVVTGRGRVDGRPVMVIADRPSGQNGTWDERAVEKVVRATEVALREELPVFWLVDAADSAADGPPLFFPGRRGVGRILHNQVALSGRVPQICCLFGPVSGDRALIARCTDVLIMVEGAASMSLGSSRMAEVVAAETVTPEELGGARLHCTVSGVGDLLAEDDADAIELAGLYFSYVPSARGEQAPSYLGEEPRAPLDDGTVPESESRPFDIHQVIDGLVDDDSFFELGPLFATELVVGFGRMDGRAVGIVANNSIAKGGVLGADGADKAARFVRTCDASSIPVIHLVDVPGFVVGFEAEHGGIIRHGTAMLSAVAATTVPQICVVVRKAYGAGLHAMCGPGLAPDAIIALPTARVAAAGPADADPDRLASDLVIDAVVDPPRLRAELLGRLANAARRHTA